MVKRVNLDKFKPRGYQIPVIDAFERDRYRFMLVILPRRAGKDLLSWNLMVRRAIQEVGNYFYCLPTFRQSRLVIWDSITKYGDRFLDYIPEELIKRTNSQEMVIELINGSIIRLIGSDTYDRSLVGTNPRLVVFSEYALSDSSAFNFIKPIISENNGSVILISTPRGANHMYTLYKMALKSPDWFVYKKSLHDTKHIPIEEVERERREGLMSEDLINQEYYVSFSRGIDGSYYSKYLTRMHNEERITKIPWRSDHKVHTAWDLGVRDHTAIIFFQKIGQTINIIDVHQDSKQGLEHYISLVKNKPYTYGTHIAPHDIRNRELTTGVTRWEKARQLGIEFTIADKLRIEDGIEAVRSLLGYLWIDEDCKELITALQNYRQEFDARLKVYKTRPLHDQYSHYADAMRYLAVSTGKLSGGMNAQDIDKLYREAMSGDNTF